MEIKQYYLTQHDCYTNPTIIKPIGFMLHSTGANNAYLKRYIQPNDGVIGENKNRNDWNKPNLIPRKMIHGFIGKDDNDIVRAYQTLPYNYEAWHAGVMSTNREYVGWEICEDGLDDPVYFQEVYNLAVYVATDFCKKYDRKANCIIDHSEGYTLGKASNHGDVKHWFSRHGKTMDDFRRDVAKMLQKKDEVSNTMDLKEFEGLYNQLMEKRKAESVSEWFESVQSEVVNKGISDGTKPRMYAERQEIWAMMLKAIDGLKTENTREVYELLLEDLSNILSQQRK